MAAAQITGCYLVVARRVRHEQDKLNSARRELPAYASEHERKEWFGKDARVVLAYDKRDRPGPPRRRRARRPVAHITEARDRLFDLTAGLRPYPRGFRSGNGALGSARHLMKLS